MIKIQSNNIDALLLTEFGRDLDVSCSNKLWNRRLGIVVLWWGSRMIKLGEAIHDWLLEGNRWLRQI